MGRGRTAATACLLLLPAGCWEQRTLRAEFIDICEAETGTDDYTCECTMNAVETQMTEDQLEAVMKSGDEDVWNHPNVQIAYDTCHL